jgi:predicted  nucleic acid-binding Zn-ribbon protein
MEAVFDKLKILQDILASKIDVELKIQEIPKLLVTQEELLNRLKKSFMDKNQEYDQAKVREGEYRNSLFEAESKIEKAEKTIEQLSTQREYEALDKEREDAEEKAKDSRAKLLKEERIVLDLGEQLKQSQALIDQQEKDLAERRRGVEAEVAAKRTQLADLVSREKSLTEDLDPEMLFKFERIIRNKMGKGIVAIKGGICLGCHMILPVQFANTVRQGLEIVFCPYCSRVLFYEESEQGEEDFFNADDAGSLSDLEDIDDDDYEEEDDDDESDSGKVSGDYEE